MANYHTQFSAMLPLPGSDDQIEDVMTLFDSPKLWHPSFGDSHPDFFDEGFEIEPVEGGLIISDGSGEGDVEAVIAFVIALAKQEKLTGLWGFSYAFTCSKGRVDAFDGGAHVIDLGKAKTVAYINAREWLLLALAEDGSGVHGTVLERARRALNKAHAFIEDERDRRGDADATYAQPAADLYDEVGEVIAEIDALNG